MLAGLWQRIRTFLAAPSGTRFRRWHRIRRQRPHALRSVAGIVGGLILIPLGVAMLVLPGPGLLVLLVAAALIAGESLAVARLLDRVDFRASASYTRWRDRYRRG
jgi:drug/metabolite transporter (DMT)-like permease